MKRNSMFAVVAFGAAALMGPFLGAAEPATERTPVIARYEKLRFGMYINAGMWSVNDQPGWKIRTSPLPPPEEYHPAKLDVAGLSQATSVP